MPNTTRIHGIDFEIEQRGVYCVFDSEWDVILSDRGAGSGYWDIHIHDKDGAIIEKKDGLSRDTLVQWAISKGYLAESS